MEKEAIYRILEEAYFSEHPHEEQVLHRLAPLLPHVKHFVDVGASLGQFTFLANRCMQDGRIDSIEADPIRFEKLAHNCAQWSANGLNRILPHHLALAARAGPVTFFSTGTDVSGGLSTHPLDHLRAETRAAVQWQKIEVPGATLDGLFADQPPDFVKMDIEGAELEALAGAERLLAEKRTRFLIELHDFEHNGLPGRVKAHMSVRGYMATDFEGKTLFEPEGLWRTFRHKVRRILLG